MSALARSMSAPHGAINGETYAEPQRRHIEVVATRTQRQARPRLVYAVVTVGGLFAVLIAQLLLSIALSDGAYQIANLQHQQRELERDAEALTEEINVLQSPQHLAVNAVTLGMVSNSSTAFLRLSDGAVLGSAIAARASDRIVLGQDRTTLISNALLADVPLTTHATQPNPTTPGTEGVATAGEQSTSVASTGDDVPAIKTR